MEKPEDAITKHKNTKKMCF